MLVVLGEIWRRINHGGHNRKGGAFEMEQPKVGPVGARRAGASESKGTEVELITEIFFIQKNLLHMHLPLLIFLRVLRVLRGS